MSVEADRWPPVQFSRRLKAKNLKSEVPEAELWKLSSEHAIPDPEARARERSRRMTIAKFRHYIPSSRNALIIRNFFPVAGKQLKVLVLEEGRL